MDPFHPREKNGYGIRLLLSERGLLMFFRHPRLLKATPFRSLENFSKGRSAESERKMRKMLSVLSLTLAYFLNTSPSRGALAEPWINRSWAFSFLCVLCGLCGSVSRAAPVADIPPRLAALMASTTNAAGTFVQTKHLADVDVSLRATGTFRFVKDGFVEWKTLEPLESTFIATPTNYTLVADGKTTTHTLADLKMSATMRPMLTGDIRALLQNFSADFTEPASNAWSLVLTPRTKEIRSFVTRLTFAGDSVPRSFSLLYANGDTLSIDLVLAPAER